jgi:plasmid stability protein
MTTMTIRNVPDAIKQTLVQQARRHRRSVNQQVLVLLEDACGYGGATDVESELEAIRALRKGVPSMSQAEIASAKREGRS